jgi:hypothetical protein
MWKAEVRRSSRYASDYQDDKFYKHHITHDGNIKVGVTGRPPPGATIRRSKNNIRDSASFSKGITFQGLYQITGGSSTTLNWQRLRGVFLSRCTTGKSAGAPLVTSIRGNLTASSHQETIHHTSEHQETIRHTSELLERMHHVTSPLEINQRVTMIIASHFNSTHRRTSQSYFIHALRRFTLHLFQETITFTIRFRLAS